ncbi:hypothetical protein J437_LFUL018743 [Ladona fulva]|uniref:B box-type domain-containing protein n=1 Tax=Ladona fulva TaxID=123851 RepID=A0A8K0PA81_LADFU|nr:hypothetical protein J437_LFUL018743 [Ladona fulva]
MESAIGSSEGQSGIIRCPVCRKEAVIPQNGLAALPANVYLQSLLRLVSARSSSRRSQPTTPETPSQIVLPSANGCSKCGAVGQLHLYICGHCHQILCSQCLPPHFTELRENMTHIREQMKTVSQRLQDAERGYKDKFCQIRTQLKDETEKRLTQVREESARLMERINGLESKRVEEGRALLGRLASTATAKYIESFDASATEGKVELFLKVSGEASELLSEASRLNEVLRSFPAFDRSSFRILDPQDEEDEEEAEEKEEEEEVEEVEEEKAENGGERREKYKCRELRRMDSRSQKRTKVLPTNHEELSLYYRSRSVTSPRWKFGGSREGKRSGELYRPAGMGVAPWGGGAELYMALSDGGKVVIFTKRSSGSGWRHSKILPPPPAKDKMMCPFGIAFSEKRKEVFITDKWCHCIHVYDSEGNWLRRLSKQGRSPGHLSSPEGIAASDAYIFVADTGNDRVQVLDASNGGFVTFVGSDISSFRMESDMIGPSAGSGYLMQPTGVALNAAESKLIICDSGHNRIKIFDISELCEEKGSISNRPMSVFGSLGSQKGQFRSARGVAVDKLGFITVADSGNARVQIFRPDGRLVRAFGSKGKEPGNFGYPTSVHIGPYFELFVSDSSNHCMYVF